ncbi:hypothetical protein [Streptomyces sp. NPDC005573]|uniref:hypothetical protein n=1 Tax=Streptomyces sp. NPDC005573 TaxID=3156890 RepID=UPI0033BA9286
MLRGVLALMAGGFLTLVACGFRNLDVWVWDRADAYFSPHHRTAWGTPWKSLGRMRLQCGIVGAGLLILGLAITLSRLSQ